MKKILNRKDIASALNLFHSKDFESRQLVSSLITELVPNLLSFDQYKKKHGTGIDDILIHTYKNDNKFIHKFYSTGESYLDYIKKTLVREYNLCFVWNRYKDSYVIYK